MTTVQSLSSQTRAGARKTDNWEADFKVFRVDRLTWRIEAISTRAADFVTRNLQVDPGPSGTALFADLETTNDLVVLFSHAGYLTEYIGPQVAL